MLATKERLFKYIPIPYEKILEEEILSLYRVFATNHAVPCLDESIMANLQFYHLSICYFYDNDEKMIDTEWALNEPNWTDMCSAYNVADYRDEYMELRNDVRIFLHAHKLFHEENWVYGLFPENYEHEIYHSPIQTVW